nr:hypothetical protein [Angustibacter aerolatus]
MPKSDVPEARLLVVEDEPNIREPAVDVPAVRGLRRAHRRRRRDGAAGSRRRSSPTCSCST